MRVAEAAARRHGVVHRRELAALGVDASTVKRWLAQGRLHREHRAVYAVGYPRLSSDGRVLAAVLACGDGCWAAARSAAGLWELAPHPARAVDVVTTRCGSRAPKGIELRRTRRLQPQDVAVIRGIPVTSVSRTLADYAALVSRRRLEQALERAERMQVLDVAGLLEACHHRPGATAIRTVLAQWSPATTKSRLEDLLLRVVERSSLPRPVTNVAIAGVECDQVWESARLVVEADSRAFHGTHAAFERDRSKDAHLTRAGYRVLRFTWRQAIREPELVVATIRAALTDAIAVEGAPRP
jgi:very-short-patch-repair endonuclease